MSTRGGNAKRPPKVNLDIALTPEKLRVGDFFGTDRQGDAVYVQELNELCPGFDGPHVHVITRLGPSCLPFPLPNPDYRFDGKWSGPVWSPKPRPDYKLVAKRLKAASAEMRKAVAKVDRAFRSTQINLVEVPAVPMPSIQDWAKRKRKN